MEKSSNTSRTALPVRAGCLAGLGGLLAAPVGAPCGLGGRGVLPPCVGRGLGSGTAPRIKIY